MRSKYKKTKQENQKALSKIFVCLVAGSIVGTLLANNIPESQTANKIAQAIKIFFENQQNITNTSYISLFLAELFKQVKVIFFIWLMAFAPISRFFIEIILFLRGMCCGFVASILFSIYKLNTVWQILIYVLPLNFIFLLITIYISFHSLKYISRSNDRNFFQYVFQGVISVLSVFIVLLCHKYFIQ